MRRIVILLLFSLAMAVTVQITAAQNPPMTNSMGTVMVYQLNVRSAPSLSGAILTRIYQGEVYPVVGRTADSRWWQIWLNNLGASGWVHSAYLNVAYPQGVPVTEGGAIPTTPPPLTNSMGTVMAWALNVRSWPGLNSTVITRAYRGEVYPVIGRTADSSWWQILLNSSGSTGWVHGAYLNVAYPQGVPVSNSPLPPIVTQPPTSHYYTTTADASIYNGPGVEFGTQGYLFAGMTANIIGRNGAGTWFQIRTDTGTGWITGSALPGVVNVGAIPVTG